MNYKLTAKEMSSLQILEERLETLRIIMDPEEARRFIHDLGDRTVALDFETTGLDPMFSHVRLSCIYHPDVGAVLLDHKFCGAFNQLAHKMLGPMWIVYNAKFEYNWFDHALATDVLPQLGMLDVDFLAKAKIGGYASSLARMAQRDLGITLDKTEQLSDWSADKLTATQIKYAGKDAIITYMLYEYWLLETNEDQQAAAFTMQDSVGAIIECEQTGMVLDVKVHEANVEKWKMKQKLMLKTLRKWTPVSVLANPGSDKQVSDLLKTQVSAETLAAWPKTEKTKQLSLNRKIVAPIAAKSPYPFSRWMNALIRYRYYCKYLNTYGETLLTKQYLEDRISYRLNIGQAATIRLSSSSINIQNIPRAPWVRKAFLPPHGFKYFVVADYSGIEIRTLAELSGDAGLLRDAIYGDVHSSSASAIFNIDEAEFLKIYNDKTHPQQWRYSDMRSRGKGFTFQNIYGAMAAALSIVLKCSIDEAEAALRAWADKYPKAYNYRYIIFDQMISKGYLPVIDGRTIYVPKYDRTMPVAANYGVQSAAASVMYCAMYHVKRLRDAETNKHLIRLAGTVHDEVLLAVADDEWIAPAKKIITDGMTQGWLDIFPDTDTNNLLEAKHGLNWGEAK